MSTTCAAADRLSTNLRYARLAALALAAITLLRLVWLVSGTTDLYPDEAQYWLWSRAPDWGYFSKPPLLAWVITATTAALGESEFAVRAGAPLLHLATAGFIFAAAQQLYDSRTACWASIAYATLPGVSFSAGVISTDVPLLACWGAALYFFIRAREADGGAAGRGWGWWALAGVAAGLGLLAKYAMAYWLLSALLYLLLVREERRHLPRFLAAALLSLVIYSPNFFWNLAHGFVSYAHTRHNANLAGPLIHPRHFLEFFGSQFLVFGPVFFATLVVLAVGFRRFLVDRRDRMLACFALPTLAMMLVVSFLSRAHPNWSAPTYVSGVILVVAWLLRPRGRVWGRRLFAASVALHVIPVVIVLMAAAAGIDLLPPKIDLFRRVRGWSEFAGQVDRFRAEHPGLVLMGDDREELAALIYYGRPHPFDAVKWNPNKHRSPLDHFELTTAPARGGDYLLVTRDSEQVARDMVATFASTRSLGGFTVSLGPDRQRWYHVYELHGFKGYR